MLDKLIQSTNASYPIVVIVSGKTMLVKLLLPRKPNASISVTGYPETVEGMMISVTPETGWT